MSAASIPELSPQTLGSAGLGGDLSNEALLSGLETPATTLQRVTVDSY